MARHGSLEILWSAGARGTQNKWEQGLYAGGYYPAPLTDAVQEVGCEAIFSEVSRCADHVWAYRMLILTPCLTAIHREKLWNILENAKDGDSAWGTLFVFGASMDNERRRIFVHRLAGSGDKYAIGAALQYVKSLSEEERDILNWRFAI